MTLLILILVAGIPSAGVYLYRRQWIDAALVLAAALALAGLVGDFPMPADSVAVAGIDSNAQAPAIGEAARVRLNGDGLRSAQWDDLPARPLDWTPPKGDVLRLAFPSQLLLGRAFSLTATMPLAARRKLQLLAENGQVLAETAGTTGALTVQWLPPVAETMVLRARLSDAGGKVVAEGPVPLIVRDPVPLKVQGRFGSPSFDARVLNELLADSNALVDWHVTLGKAITRNETARAPIDTPELLVVDAAYLERLSETARSALLAQVARGAPLLILAATASDPGFWSRTMQLGLKEQSDAKLTGTPLALASAGFNPVAGGAGPWSSAGDRIWSRPWQQGRIAWLGVVEWHRYAITEPRALGLWWQDVLDRAGVRRSDNIVWLTPSDMPLPGQRMAVCAQGVSGEVRFPELHQTLAWQRRSDKADSACVAVWPAASGWLTMQSGAAASQLYVYDKADWPLWQKAQRRDATLRYAARTPAPVSPRTVSMPAWPFALTFMAAMLALWWRERR